MSGCDEGGNCFGFSVIRCTTARKAWRNCGTISGACASYQARASARSACAAAVNRTRGIHRVRLSGKLGLDLIPRSGGIGIGLERRHA